MAKCSNCGCEFDLTHARRRISAIYFAGAYDDNFPDGDMCDECADEIMGADYAAGAEIMELNGRFWDD